MPIRYTVVFAVSLVLFTGCLSLERPSSQQREKAAARASRDLIAHRAELEKVTSLVFASDHPTTITFSSHGDKGNLTYTATDLGLAVGISDDGYLLTAAHVAKEYCYVLGWMGGKQAVSPARVVYRQVGSKPGEEWAILHVNERLDHSIKFGTLDTAGSDIYAFACERERDLKVIAVGGKITHRPEPKHGEAVSVLATDLPLWKGDSGSGVISKDGKLVGVFIAVSKSLPSFEVSRLVSIPDFDRVQSVIEEDRLQAEKPNKSLQPTAAAPGS